LRLPRLSLSDLSPQFLARVAVATLGLGVVAGCETKSFFDPSEMGNYRKGDPLVLPIMNTLQGQVEEPQDEFLNATDPRPEDLVASDADYVVGKNDLISVTINDLVAPNVETTKTTRVSESGNISLPLFGQIKAAGLTEAELEAAVADAYAKAKIIDKAQVSVTVNEARGRAFSILGAVGAPGQYAIVNSDFRVLDALVLARDVQQVGVDYMYIIRKVDGGTARPAGGATPPAGGGTTRPAGGGSEVFEPRGQAKPFSQPVLMQTAGNERITRPAGQPQPFTGFQAPGPQSDKRVIRIPLTPLRNGDLRYNVVVKPQDMVIVPLPTIGEYYMGGHVQRVGVYSLTGRKITLKQAVVSAGMLDAVAIPERTDVIRRIGPDQEVTVRVNLAKIFAGDQSDIYLKPNDVVQVGTNAFAPFLAAMRGGFRFTYGFGFLYDRNFYDQNDDN
jgi:polysaccharide export outer membrane protein